MRIAVISDTHLGSGHSALADPSRAGYKGFWEALSDYSHGSRYDYLVVAGDILDFSVSNYHTAYDKAKQFFERVHKDITDKVIYLPGNHDCDLWHILQHYRHVILRLAEGDKNKKPDNSAPADPGAKSIRVFQHSVPAILDDRTGSTPPKLELFGVSKPNDALAEGKEYEYSGLFLENWIKSPDKPDHLNFYFAYPNLYFATDSNTFLITHGHYLDMWWSMLGELVHVVDPPEFDDDVEQFVELNFPQNQLACTGIGQADTFTDIAREVRETVGNGDYSLLETYLNRFQSYVSSKFDVWYAPPLLWFAGLLKGKFMDGIKDNVDAHRKADWLEQKDVVDRFSAYFQACLLELEKINDSRNEGSRPAAIAKPDQIIFGHTHLPYSWNDTKYIELDLKYEKLKMPLNNTGGWVMEGDTSAELFLYETGKGFSSVNIAL